MSSELRTPHGKVSREDSRLDEGIWPGFENEKKPNNNSKISSGILYGPKKRRLCLVCCKRSYRIAPVSQQVIPFARRSSRI